MLAMSPAVVWQLLFEASLLSGEDVFAPLPFQFAPGIYSQKAAEWAFQVHYGEVTWVQVPFR
jgi:hypothetical protein